MTPDEMAKVMDRVRRTWPHQQQDELAVGIWAEVVGRYPYTDVAAAVRLVAATAEFGSLQAVKAAVDRLRDDRVRAVAMPAPPVDPDDVTAYLTERREMEALVRDGVWGQEALNGYALAVEGPTRSGAPRRVVGRLAGAPDRAAVAAFIAGAIPARP